MALGAVAGVFDYQKGDEMNAQKPDRHELQANGKHPAPCAKFCEATAFTIELRRAQAEIKVQTRAADHWMAEANKSHNLTVTQQAENAQWRVDFKEMVIARDAALARLAITEEANSMLLARNKWLEHTLEVAGASPVEPSQAQPSAPSDTAITYMTGYSDGKEWAGATNLAQQEPVNAMLMEALERMVESVTGVDQVSAVNEARAALTAAKQAQPEPSDLRGIDACPVAEWVDLVKRGYVSRDECLIAVKDIPLWIAKNSEQAQPPAPGEAAREYMTGYSDAKEWAGATNQAQPSQALELVNTQRVCFIRGWDARGMFSGPESSEERDMRMRELLDAYYPHAAINAKGVV